MTEPPSRALSTDAVAEPEAAAEPWSGWGGASAGSGPEQSRRLFWWAFAASLFLCLQLFAASAFVDQDDPYIYFRAARHVVAGHGPVFNPGDAHLAVTSPAWTLWLAVFEALGADLTATAKWSSALLLAAASLFGALLLRPFVGPGAGFAPFAFFCTPAALHAAGGEVPLTLFGAFVALWACTVERRPKTAGAALALAVLGRGETLVLAGLLSVWLVLDARRQEISLTELARRWAPGAIAFALPLIAWLAYAWGTVGSFLPETLQAKVLQGASGEWDLYRDRVPGHVALAFRHSGSFVILALVGAVVLLPRLTVLLLWPVLHALAYAGIGVAYYHWYFYDLDVALGLFVLAGLAWTVRVLRALLEVALEPLSLSMPITARQRTGIITVLCGGALVMGLVTQARVGRVKLDDWRAFLPANPLDLVRGARRDDALQREAVYRRAIDWFEEEVHSAGAGSTIVAAEIGFLGYLLPEAEVRDVVGLASPLQSVDQIHDWGLQVRRHDPEWLFDSFGSAADLWPLMGAGGYPVRYRKVYCADTEGKFRGCWYRRDDAQDLARLHELGRGSADGAEPDYRVVGSEVVLYATAPSTMRVTPPEGTRELHFTHGFDVRVLTEPIGDGAHFSVAGVDAEGREVRLWSRFLHPQGREEHRGSHAVRLELPADLRELVFRVEPGDSELSDWTYWGALEYR